MDFTFFPSVGLEQVLDDGMVIYLVMKIARKSEEWE